MNYKVSILGELNSFAKRHSFSLEQSEDVSRRHKDKRKQFWEGWKTLEVKEKNLVISVFSPTPQLEGYSF